MKLKLFDKNDVKNDLFERGVFLHYLQYYTQNLKYFLKLLTFEKFYDIIDICL